MVLKVFLLLLLVSFPAFAQISEILTPSEGFPIWLKKDTLRTNQTSGITFIGNEGTKKLFFLCDDTGKFWRMYIENDKIAELIEISLSDKVQLLFSTGRRPDFEEVVYDPFTDKFYVSVEGSGKNFREDAGLYEVIFDAEFSKCGMVTDLIEIKIKPEDELRQYLRSNISFEGVAVDESFFYIGLEAATGASGNFTDSTFIYIVDKKTLMLRETVNTKQRGIGTICGLQVYQGKLWGVDRNARRFFAIELANGVLSETTEFYNFSGVIPGYTDKSYIAALESLTFDDLGFVYAIDDPWTMMFVPPKKIFEQLNEETQSNFTGFIPVLYKYKIS